MTSPAPVPAGRPFTGRHMLLVMIAFFGTIIGVNALLAVVSSTSWSGLVVQNSYVASQHYQEKRDAMAAQQALGWTPSLGYADGVATFTIADGEGRPLDLGPLELTVHRPIGTEGEQALRLEAATIGHYEAALDLGPGAWDVLVTAETGTGPFEYHHRLFVEASAK